MLRFIAIRFVRGIVTLWLVVTIVFFGLRLSGDPVQMMLGDSANPTAVAALREKLGLNDPLPVQYVRYLQTIARGDFGDSLRERRPATTVVFDRIPATLQLASVSLVLTIILGIFVGVIAGLKRNSPADRLIMGISFLGQAAPAFFVGIMLILLLSLWAGILPSSGRGDWRYFIMPVVTLSTHSIATLARLTRSAVLEVLNQDYVRTARAKGLGEVRVVMGHVLRNAAIPVITLLGLMVAGAVSGTVVVETVFAWPGMGRLAANAVFNRDYPVIQLIVLLIAASVVVANFLVDLLYGVLDPRIRY